MSHLTRLCVRYVKRFMPDPYLFAAILTIIVVMLTAPLVRDTTAASMFKARYSGVWGSQHIFHLHVTDGAGPSDWATR